VSRLSGKGSILSRLVLPLILAAAAYLVLIVYGRVDELGAALRSFQVVYLVPILALVLANYALRFARWHYYLRRCGAGVPARESAAVFFSGFAMSITPARLGELLKCVLLRDEAGVRMSVSVPVVVADRVNDLVAICILVAAGMLRYSAARGATLVAIAGVAALVVALGFSPWIAEGATRLFARRFATQSPTPAVAVREAADVFAQLLRGRALAFGTLLGVLAWFAECAALYLVLGGLGSWTLTLYAATFVYALSTLAGALSLLPGGLGVTELGMTALLVLFGVARETAVAAVVIVRLCTLWFAAGLGVVVYLLHRRKVARALAETDGVTARLKESPVER
jgi:glycosyltransferase 2 family protein